MPDRIILINKPYRWTSFDVVKKLRKPLLEERKRELAPAERSGIKKLKVGHAGTLDPLATGLLILCSGKLTRQISEIQNDEKEYTGTMTIGSITDSFDLETPPHSFLSIDNISEEKIYSVAASFWGNQLQTPPIHSAKKIDGKRAYEKARKGEIFEMKSQSINISAFDITLISLPEISFRIVCTKGTYIRSLIHDFGQRLTTGAHLSALCRTRIGSYCIEDALTPDEFLSQLSEKQYI